MKLWSKEAFVLGGIYGVLSTPCAYLGLENIGIMLFFLFVVGVFLLFFNKMPESFSKTIKLRLVNYLPVECSSSNLLN